MIGSPFVNNIDTFQNSYLLSAFCKPGKHSVYVYIPTEDKFYKKTIAVEASESFINRGHILDNMKIGGDDMTPE